MKQLFTFCLLISSALSLQAQIFNPVKWETNLEQTGENTYSITFTAAIDDGWFVYSADMNDEGPVPTTIDFDTEDGYELDGGLLESGKVKAGFDPIFEMDVKKYANKVTFTQKITTDGNLDEIEGYLTFMTCDDKRCLPPTDVDFSFELD